MGNSISDSYLEKAKEEYKRYIRSHRNGVLDTWRRLLRPQFVDKMSVRQIEGIDHRLFFHDESKLREPELTPYALYFSDHSLCPKSGSMYQGAWNHHQKNNPHHWQYWILMNDETDPKTVALEMPIEYVIEMLCDWQSASDYYGNTAHWWYETQKDNMLLHYKTRQQVEELLQYLT